MLPERVRYLGLLLYSYDDEERRQLKQFQWQLCNSAPSIKDVAQWLRRDNFPSLTNSSKILKGIGDGQIGTDNDTILNEIVAPTGNPTLIIKIGWPNGGPLGSEVQIYSRLHQGQKARAYAHIRVGH